MIHFQLLALKCRNSWAVSGLRPPTPSFWQEWAEKRGCGLREAWSLPALLSRLQICPCLPTLPSSHHSVMVPQHRATVQSPEPPLLATVWAGGPHRATAPSHLCSFPQLHN